MQKIQKKVHAEFCPRDHLCNYSNSHIKTVSFGYFIPLFPLILIKLPPEPRPPPKKPPKPPKLHKYERPDIVEKRSDLSSILQFGIFFLMQLFVFFPFQVNQATIDRKEPGRNAQVD